MEMARVSDVQLINDFLKDCELRKMSKHSVESYGSTLTIFKKFVERKGYDLCSIDKKILQENIKYFQRNDLSYKTMQNRFSTYISFYDYLYDRISKKNEILPLHSIIQIKMKYGYG